MTFELLPTLDIMLDLYQKPRTIERFQEYLKMLQGDTKGDLALPIGGFNPMAKEYVFQKLIALKDLHAEQLIQGLLSNLNQKFASHSDRTNFRVAINVSDDLKGGWTNRYTSDYDSKFKINALINRGFCVPIFWTSEEYSETLIKTRTSEFLYRSIYWLIHPKPKTLREHIEQEIYVAKNTNKTTITNLVNLEELDIFYKLHQDSDSYSLIFNFLYGDAASKSLEFTTYGIADEMAGFEYAKLLAK